MVLPKPALGLLVGGKYRLVDHIGGGGMGEVYRAEHVLAGRLVALKLLRPEFAQDEELTRRFFQEAQAVNRIRHANIVDVLDAGIAETGPYIAMEYLVGEPLSAVLTRAGKLSIGAAGTVGIGVLSALGAAHRVGVIHRDLKPQNVFLHRLPTGTAGVKLLDFGVAKVESADERAAPRTHAGLILGTPDYLSPEQASGETDLDPRSDLFAAGVLLFELLTGVRPFAAPTAIATAYRVVHAEAPRLDAVGGPAAPALQAVIDRALRKDRSERFEDAASFAAALAEAAPPASNRDELASLVRIPASPTDRRGEHPDRSASRPRAKQGGEIPTDAPPVAAGRLAGPSGTPAPSAEVLLTPPAVRADPTLLSGTARPSSGARPTDRPGTARSEPSRSSSLSARLPDSASRGSERASRPPEPASMFPPAAPPRAHPPRVRGALLGALDAALAARFGETMRDRILARMPPDLVGDFRHGTIGRLERYDLSSFEVYAVAANEVLFGNAVPLGQAARPWRELGREAARNEVIRLLLRPMERGSADLASLVRRGLAVWSRLVEFSAWIADDQTDGTVLVRVGDMTPAPVALRQFLVGIVEESLRLAGRSRIRVEILLGEVGRTPELRFQIGET